MCTHDPACPASSVEQMNDVFHELHAEGRHALCAVCDSQYRQPAEKVTSDISRWEHRALVSLARTG